MTWVSEDFVAGSDVPLEVEEETVDKARLKRGYYRVVSDVSVGMPPVED